MRFMSVAEKLTLPAILALALFLRLAFATGQAGSDDINYFKGAIELRQRLFGASFPAELVPCYSLDRWGNHDYRYGVTFPLAVALLGLSVEAAAIVVPCVFSLASVGLAYVIARRLFGHPTACWSALAMAVLPSEVLLGTVVLAEVFLVFYVGVAILLLVRADAASCSRSAPAWSLASGVFFGLAWLAKETAVFVLAAAVLWLLLRRRRAVLPALLLAGAAAVLALECTISYARSGDVLARFHSSAETVEAWRQLQGDRPLYSVLIGDLAVYFFRDGGMLGMFLFLGCFAALWLFALRNGQLVLLWIAVPLLYLAFGSASLSHYTPFNRGCVRIFTIVDMPLAMAIGAMLFHSMRQFEVLRPGLPRFLSVLAILFLLAASTFTARRYAGRLYHATYAQRVQRAAAVLAAKPLRPILTDGRTGRLLQYYLADEFPERAAAVRVVQADGSVPLLSRPHYQAIDHARPGADLDPAPQPPAGAKRVAHISDDEGILWIWSCQPSAVSRQLRPTQRPPGKKGAES